MGASNFHKVNASKYFVICESELDEETGEVLEFQDHEWEMEYIKEYFKDKHPRGLGYYSQSFSDKNECRSYPSQSICSLHDCKTFGDVDIQIEIGIVVRSGYYEAANLDYNIRYVGLAYWYDEMPDALDIENDLLNHSDMNAGLCKIQSNNVEKWLNKRVEEIKEAVEKMFEEIANPMQVAYQFSNGETGYTTA